MPLHPTDKRDPPEISRTKRAVLGRGLTRLLIEHDERETALPECRHVLIRAKIGRQVADALSRIGELQNAIATTPARTPAEAAVQRRRLAALSSAGILP